MTYVLGVDVSRHQGVMDWQKCYDAGARFAIIRAGSIDSITGKCYKDYQFDRNSEIAPEYMPVGYYWYFRPNYSAEYQGNFFSNLIRDKKQNIPPSDDAEALVSMETHYIEKQHESFLDTIDKNLSVLSMIYTNVGYWSYPNIYVKKGIPEWAAKRPHWNATWTLGERPWLPVTWNSWVFWQFSGDGNGRGAEFGASGSHAIDLNRFNGDMDAFLVFCGVASPPEPPEPPIEPPVDPEPPNELYLPYIVNAPRGLYTHSEPNSLVSTRKGALFDKTRVYVIETQGDWKLCRAEYWSHGDYLIKE